MKQFQLRTWESTRLGLHQHLLKRDADLVAHCKAVFSSSVARRSRPVDSQPGAWSRRKSFPTSKPAPPETSSPASVPGHIGLLPALDRRGFHTPRACAHTTGARDSELRKTRDYAVCVDELYLETRTQLTR